MRAPSPRCTNHRYAVGVRGCAACSALSNPHPHRQRAARALNPQIALQITSPPGTSPALLPLQRVHRPWAPTCWPVDCLLAFLAPPKPPPSNPRLSVTQIGGGLRAFQVRRFNVDPTSRAFYAMRKDGSYEDFSYLKCTFALWGGGCGWTGIGWARTRLRVVGAPHARRPGGRFATGVLSMCAVGRGDWLTGYGRAHARGGLGSGVCDCDCKSPIPRGPNMLHGIVAFTTNIRKLLFRTALPASGSCTVP